MVLTFPGEKHTDWLRRHAKADQTLPTAPQCRPLPFLGAVLPANFDRLSLPNTSFVDNDKIASIEKVAAAKGQKPYQSDRTRRFQGRDLRCGDFAGADLRRAEFAGADLSYASFAGAELQGARFGVVDLTGASLVGAHLEDASFLFATLDRADLTRAGLKGMALSLTSWKGALFAEVSLPGFDFSSMQLQGASFKDARLQAAKFNGTHLQGADFADAQLQGATFLQVELTGANFARANLQGATFQGDLRSVRFGKAGLQGARLNARLQGADFHDAQLQAIRTDGSDIRLAYLARAHLWGAGGTARLACEQAQVIEANFEPFLDPSVRRNHPRIGVAADDAATFAENATRGLADEFVETVRGQMLSRLRVEPAMADERNARWTECAAKALRDDEYRRKLVAHLVDTACADEFESYIARGIALHWMNDTFLGDSHPRADSPISDPDVKALARGILARDGKPCPGAKDLDSDTRSRLEVAAGSSK